MKGKVAWDAVIWWLQGSNSYFPPSTWITSWSLDVFSSPVLLVSCNLKGLQHMLVDDCYRTKNSWASECRTEKVGSLYSMLTWQCTWRLFSLMRLKQPHTENRKWDRYWGSWKSIHSLPSFAIIPYYFFGANHKSLLVFLLCQSHNMLIMCSCHFFFLCLMIVWFISSFSWAKQLDLLSSTQIKKYEASSKR